MSFVKVGNAQSIILINVMKLLLLFFLLFGSVACVSQGEEWRVLVNSEDVVRSKEFKGVNRRNYLRELSRIRERDISDGFLTANVDSVKVLDSVRVLRIYYHKGERYKWAKLSVSDEDREIVSEVGYAEKVFANRPLSPYRLADFIEKVLVYLENNGYPFAQVKLDSVDLGSGNVSAKLEVEKGERVVMDTIFIKTKDDINPEIVYNFIRIKPKDVYRQNLIDEISNRVKEVPYWSMVSRPEYEFIGNKCRLFLYLKTNPTNSFNGVLGIQPDKNGKVTITGEMKVSLLNSFKRSEKIFFNWKKLRTLTQSLDAGFAYPFLLGTKIGVDTRLHIYKRDSSYVDADFRLGLDYLYSGLNKMSVFFENKNSTLLSVQQYEQATSLPDFADVTKKNYGIHSYFERLDYRFNPRKGWRVNSTVSIGTKRIKQISTLPSALYDGIKLNSVSYKGGVKISVFIPLFKRATIKTGIKGATIYNDNLFKNELYRIGGESTIRGFDQQSIFASSYLISTVEYRFLFEQNANFFLFSDVGILERNDTQGYSFDTPYSFGTGISFETKAGIFRLSYALGSQNDSPLYLRSAKIHFGFVSLF